MSSEPLYDDDDDDSPVRNPSPPLDFVENGTDVFIGDTMYSKSWVINTLLKIVDVGKLV